MPWHADYGALLTKGALNGMFGLHGAATDKGTECRHFSAWCSHVRAHTRAAPAPSRAAANMVPAFRQARAMLTVVTTAATTTTTRRQKKNKTKSIEGEGKQAHLVVHPSLHFTSLHVSRGKPLLQPMNIQAPTPPIQIGKIDFFLGC